MTSLTKRLRRAGRIKDHATLPPVTAPRQPPAALDRLLFFDLFKGLLAFFLLEGAGLGNLKMIYDDNRISIEGDTHVAFTEDVAARYRAYGWNVLDVPVLSDGNIDRENLERAMVIAESTTDRPTFIRLHSVIAWPAPHAQGTGESHGSALGDEEVAATKVLLGLDPTLSFFVPEDVLEHARKVIERGQLAHAKWSAELEMWREENPERASLLERLRNKTLPADWSAALPVFPAGKDVATRAASGKVINAIAAILPEFWGGSADLAGSNNTTIAGSHSFLPATSHMEGADPYGHLIHFGIREHAMGGILNGIALHGLSKPFGGTFLVFSDYMRGAVRLSAIMNLPVTFVWTHDSIGLGEDGPTHQPVEHLASLRLIPNLAVVRPADANETAVAWREIITRTKPTGLALSRQNLPVIDRNQFSSAEGVAKGAYVVSKADGVADVILIATGSEVSLALAAQQLLLSEGIKAQVVSAPCLEWFEETSAEYKESVLPSAVRARVSIEAGVSAGWREYVGDAGVSIGLNHFGASASAAVLFKEFGFTPEAVASAAKESIAKAGR